MLRAALAAFVLAVCALTAPADASDTVRTLTLTTTFGGPQIVVGPPRAERMTVTFRGVTKQVGLAYPVGASVFGQSVPAVGLPDDLRAGEKITVEISPADAGGAHLINADSAIGAGTAGARATGVVLGVFLVVLLLQLVTFVTTRESSTVWYVLLVGGLAAVELVRAGVLPFVRDAGPILVIDLWCFVAATGFIASYLRLWSQARGLFWLLTAPCTALVAVGAFAATLPAFHPQTETLRVPLVLLYCLIALSVIVIRAQRYAPAWIVFGGTILLVTATAYREVRAYIGTPFLDHWAFEIGASLDALVFATAIMVRIRYSLVERRSIERRLVEATYEAHHDPLTGALNRRGLFAQAPGMGGTVFVIDLDNFKAINDRYGHATGDRALIEVVRKLRGLTGPADAVARIGGDEFVVVTAAVDQHAAGSLAQRFAAEIATIQPAGVPDGPKLGASVGYVPIDAGGFELAMRRADAQTYQVKRLRPSIAR